MDNICEVEIIINTRMQYKSPLEFELTNICYVIQYITDAEMRFISSLTLHHLFFFLDMC